MLSKCANPQCSAKFRYLHDGKVFRVDFEERSAPRPQSGVGTPVASLGAGTGPALLSSSSGRRPEYFWLCSACSEQMTLAADGSSVVLLPLPVPPVLRRAAAS